MGLVVIGTTETRESVLYFAEAGSSGHASKDSSMEDLQLAIHLGFQGKQPYPQDDEATDGTAVGVCPDFLRPRNGGTRSL